MGHLKDITGNKYERLSVIGLAGKSKAGKYLWKCVCECGNELTVSGSNLKTGHTRSCGCIGAGGHNMSYSPEYMVWHGLKNRCETPSSGGYDNYGGRGIKVQESWSLDFMEFYKDMGPRPTPQHTIERIDSNGDYCKENCIWTDDRSLQTFNQRKRKTNSSGRTGVRLYKDTRWAAEICVKYKQIILGYYDTFEEAVKAREEAELKYYGFIKE